GNPLREFAGATDAKGAFTVTMALPVTSRAERFTFEAEVVDATRRAVVADTAIMVHPAAFALTLRPDRYGIKVGEAFGVTATTIDHDGTPVPGNLVAVRALRYSYPGGYITVDEETLTTGDDGQARGTLNLGAGWYRVTASARDEAGRRLETQTWAWVSDARRPWYWREDLQINADRDSYSAGDTATLVIRSPVTTTALVTLERDDVVEEMVVDVAGATEVEVPIKAEFAPNIWAKVQLWDPREQSTYGQSAAVARLISAQTNLRVSAADRRLDVTITADEAAYEPGDTISYEIRVADARGAPVEAQLSFALVDKAVLALAADTSGDIFDAFWGSRGNSVATFDSLRPSDWYEYPEEDLNRGAPGAPSPSPTGTPAAGGPPPSENQPGEAAPRREFPDTAYWKADLVTARDGIARVTLRLPDNLTTWQAMARAITVDTLAGQGRADTLVTKAVIADPALPRFAVQGDTFALDVLARNYTATDLAGSCSLAAPGLTQLDPGNRALDLPVNTTQFARWSVVASDIGTSLVTATL
ncbi:MAG: alpha-2-macroglobulin family protein, partial [Anaerolineae bacterium]